jgi:FtsP/CotA-like multicopper oxidase with cupredoxin domain
MKGYGMKQLFASIVLACLSFAASAQATVHQTLVIRNISDKTMWDGNTMNVYGFGPTINNIPVPGPTIYCNEGDTIDLYTINISQGAGHTIHPHGMDVPQTMDGVHETSFEIEHMMDTNLVWVATHAGTYIYHCHMASVLHVQMGMYGSIVVRAAGGVKTAYTGGPAFHKDYLWLMSEMDSYWHDSIPGAAFMEDDFQVPPYEPDYFLVNGLSETELADSSVAITAMVGEKVYLRLSNIGYNMNEVILPVDMTPTILTVDGRPVPPLQRDTIRLVPGERYEVMLTPTQELAYTAEVRYLNMNNLAVRNTQQVPITINGVLRSEPMVGVSGQVHVWPNPTREKAWIRIPKEKTGQAVFTLSTLEGKELRSWQAFVAGGGDFEFDVHGIPSGIYLMVVTIKGQQANLKICIE